MEKYISCLKQNAKSYFNTASSANKITFSFEREDKLSEEKDNYEINCNPNNNEEDVLYYHFFRNYDHVAIGSENDLRKENVELFANSNLKVENNMFSNLLNENANLCLKKEAESGSSL